MFTIREILSDEDIWRISITINGIWHIMYRVPRKPGWWLEVDNIAKGRQITYREAYDLIQSRLDHPDDEYDCPWFYASRNDGTFYTIQVRNLKNVKYNDEDFVCVPRDDRYRPGFS